MGHRQPRCESPVSDRELRTRLAAMWHGGQCLLLGVKQTLDRMSGMSAFDPQQTFVGYLGLPLLNSYSAVVGSITDCTRAMLFAGNPPF